MDPVGGMWWWWILCRYLELVMRYRYGTQGTHRRDGGLCWLAGRCYGVGVPRALTGTARRWPFACTGWRGSIGTRGRELRRHGCTVRVCRGRGVAVHGHNMEGMYITR